MSEHFVALPLNKCSTNLRIAGQTCSHTLKILWFRWGLGSVQEAKHMFTLQSISQFSCAFLLFSPSLCFRVPPVSLFAWLHGSSLRSPTDGASSSVVTAQTAKTTSLSVFDLCLGQSTLSILILPLLQIHLLGFLKLNLPDDWVNCFCCVLTTHKHKNTKWKTFTLWKLKDTKDKTHLLFKLSTFMLGF